MTFGANAGATAVVVNSKAEFIDRLRYAGFTRRAAETAADHGFAGLSKSTDQRNDDDGLSRRDEAAVQAMLKALDASTAALKTEAKPDYNFPMGSNRW